MMLKLLLASLACTTVLACAGEGEGEGEAGEGEGEGEGDASDIVLEETKQIDVDTSVDPFAIELGGGIAVTARADGRYAFVFTTGGDGSTVTCQTFDNVTPPPAALHDVVVIDEQPDGSARTRIVDSVPPLFDDSLDIAVDPVSDALVVAYIGGDIAKGVCQSSDLVVAVETGDTFTKTTVAASSSDGSGPCRTSQDVCAKGDVVGRFPGLALNGTRSVLAYLDLHFGFAADDIFGSDLEVGLADAETPASGLTIQTACGDAAAGNDLGVTLTSDGKAVIAHSVIASNNLGDLTGAPYVTCPAAGVGVGILHKGIYAEFETDVPGVFSEVQLVENGDVSSHISVAQRDGQGTFVLFREDGTKQLVLARTVDDGLSYTLEFPEKLGLTGLSPTVSFLSDGTQVLAYGHCKDIDDSVASCDPKQDGVRVAWRGASETTFHKKTFTGDDEDLEGKKTDMVVTADDTILVVSFNITQDQFTIQRMKKTP